MRLFVSEYVCSGAWPGPNLEGSLAREGRAMLLAILQDFGRIEGINVVTTWDHRLGPPPASNVQFRPVAAVREERLLFGQLAESSDATLIIAPEFSGILSRRSRRVESVGKRLVGSASTAVDACTDKLTLSQKLRAAGVAAIETASLTADRRTRDEIGFPAVVKPRDGAGSQETYLVADAVQLERVISGLSEDSLLRHAVLQPYAEGTAVSVALVIDRHSGIMEAFPPAAQLLSDDGRFHYLGGCMPALLDDPAAVQETAIRACRLIAGLNGYVGVDLIVPSKQPQGPIVVEINPRLTTGYLGYRLLANENLATRILFPEMRREAVSWQDREVSFEASGNTVRDFSSSSAERLL